MRTSTAIIFTLLLLATTSSSQPFLPDANTQGLWHFDEAAGNTIAFDASGHGYNMVLQNGADFTSSGYYGGAVDLTDPDARVNSVYTVGNGWGAITLEAWIYPTQIGPATGWFDGHPIITRQEFHNVSDCSYYLYLTALGEIYAGVNLNEPGGDYSQAITPAGSIQENTWYHVAMTWSNGQPLRIFIDDMNNPVATSAAPGLGAVRTGSDGLRIGCNWTVEYYNEWEYFNGFIDEARISDLDRYPVQPGGAPFEPDQYTEALWHFDEIPGTFIAMDASGNGYNLALQDGAQFTPAGLYAGGVDLTAQDAKINSVYLIGNGWDELTIDAHVKLTQFNPDENPVVERYQYYTTNPAYYLTILPGGQIYAGVYQTNGGYASLTTGPVITLNAWYYIQMTWSSGGELKVFVNGTLAESEPSDVGAIRNSTHPLTLGWFHDTGYGDFYMNGYLDEVRISNTDRSEPSAGSPVQITLTPTNLPIVIPQAGGGFSFDINLENTSEFAQSFDVWCSVEVPGGSQFLTIGPIPLNLDPGMNVGRLRTQSVPGSAPAGQYFYRGFVGDHPWHVGDADFFTFSKAGTDGGNWFDPTGWECSGEVFPGETAKADLSPYGFAQMGASPNPFNPTTTLTFTLPLAARVSLEVFDINGRAVGAQHAAPLPAGSHELIFDGSNLPSGIYFARLTAGEYSCVQKLVLLK
ncbi:MAG: T9SS type A sorting domain-containing protein [bacterium]|nr:T9SS type A sorting domain-containing protein [bacterium]